jgi:ADP-ribose pyrophosphatase
MAIRDEKIEFSTRWFQLVSRRDGTDPAPYFSLRMQDYVCVVALTPAKEIVLVRQYRPAVERVTLELPSGHVEKNETPAESASRELVEECGYRTGDLDLLGKLLSDTGRNENRLWCFLTDSLATVSDFIPEPGVERVLIPVNTIPELIRSGEFDFSMHLAALLLAQMKRRLSVFG